MRRPPPKQPPPKRPRGQGRPTTPDPAPNHAAPEAGADRFEADEPERGPLRRCVATRARLPKEAMIRFVIGPGRELVPDLAARLPGRGIWLSARADVLEDPRTRSALARAARGPVTVPPDLASGLQIALARRIGDTLGLARRAGQAVAGFTRARAWLAAGRVAVAVQASDGSAAERARFLGGHAGTIPAIAPLSGAALGGIFGRDHVVHVAVAPGRLAERLAIDAARLAGLRMTPPAPGPAGAGRREKGNSPVGGSGGERKHSGEAGSKAFRHGRTDRTGAGD